MNSTTGLSTSRLSSYASTSGPATPVSAVPDDQASASTGEQQQQKEEQDRERERERRLLRHRSSSQPPDTCCCGRTSTRLPATSHPRSQHDAAAHAHASNHIHAQAFTSTPSPRTREGQAHITHLIDLVQSPVINSHTSPCQFSLSPLPTLHLHKYTHNSTTSSPLDNRAANQDPKKPNLIRQTHRHLPGPDQLESGTLLGTCRKHRLVRDGQGESDTLAHAHAHTHADTHAHTHAQVVEDVDKDKAKTPSGSSVRQRTRERRQDLDLLGIGSWC